MNNIQGQAVRKAHKAQYCWPPWREWIGKRKTEGSGSSSKVPVLSIGRPNQNTKFRRNRLIAFAVIFLTDWQTNSATDRTDRITYLAHVTKTRKIWLWRTSKRFRSETYIASPTYQIWSVLAKRICSSTNQIAFLPVRLFVRRVKPILFIHLMRWLACQVVNSKYRGGPTSHGAATRACIMRDPGRGTNCIYATCSALRATGF